MKILKLLFLFLLTTITVTGSSCANLASAEAPASAFSASPVLPDNQQSNVSYFDLQLQPDTKQTIQMKIINNETTAIHAKVQLNKAATGRNGIIIYDQEDNTDESLTLPVTEIAEVKTPNVYVPPKDSVFVDIDITMPKEPIRGTILGGIVVTASMETDSSQGQEERSGIQHEYAFITALKLTQDTIITKPDFILKSIEPGLVNYHTAVIVNLQNTEPAIVKGMLIKGAIYYNNSKEPINNLYLEQADVSPNSNFDLIFDWENEPVRAGEYRLKLRAEFEEQVWEWDEYFIIEDIESVAVNEDAVTLNTKTFDLRYLWILVILLLLLVVYYLGKRNGKGHQDSF